ADGLAGGADIVASVASADPAVLLRVAQLRLTNGGVVALVGQGENDHPVVILCSPASGRNAGQLLRTVAERLGGRGGGRREHAQGRVPAREGWVKLVTDTLAGA
ncbi:MAG: DHHA1 domain-containing protein, partial [Myxococcota bacterium]